MSMSICVFWATHKWLLFAYFDGGAQVMVSHIMTSQYSARANRNLYIKYIFRGTYIHSLCFVRLLYIIETVVVVGMAIDTPRGSNSGPPYRVSRSPHTHNIVQYISVLKHVKNNCVYLIRCIHTNDDEIYMKYIYVVC